MSADVVELNVEINTSASIECERTFLVGLDVTAATDISIDLSVARNINVEVET